MVYTVVSHVYKLRRSREQAGYGRGMVGYYSYRNPSPNRSARGREVLVLDRDAAARTRRVEDQRRRLRSGRLN